MDTVTIPQLDPEAFPDPRPTPELDLLVAILELAFRDLKQPEHQAEALAFVASEDFEMFREWLGWDAKAVRAAVASRK